MKTMIMTPADCLATVIKPALIALGLDQPNGEQFMLAIALQESGLRTRHQGSGPALGFWQMEPATHDDCWENYLDHHPLLAAKVMAVCDGATPSAALMISNDRYACAMARIKLLRVADELPKLGDIQGYAAFWKRWYNTPKGAGTTEEFIANWKAIMETQPAAPASTAAAIITPAPRRVMAIMNPLGIVPDSDAKAFRDALDIQINQHVAPAWGVQGADIVFVEDRTLNLENCAPDWEPLVLLDETDTQGVLGYHYDLTAGGKPAGKIFVGTDNRYGEIWTTTGSHEGVEQFIDPLCNSLALSLYKGRSVLVLREACDAVEAQTYLVGLIAMSNFNLPTFFDTITPHPAGTKFDYLGNVKNPMEIADGGYLSMKDIGAGTDWTQVFGEKVPMHKMIPPPGSRRDRFLAGHHRLRRAPGAWMSESAETSTAA